MGHERRSVQRKEGDAGGRRMRDGTARMPADRPETCSGG